jgi:hypothetical protein
MEQENFSARPELPVGKIVLGFLGATAGLFGMSMLSIIGYGSCLAASDKLCGTNFRSKNADLLNYKQGFNDGVASASLASMAGKSNSA